MWPVSLLRHPVANVASSDAVKEVLHLHPWADSGLSWKGTMVFKEWFGEDRSALMAAASKPGQPTAKGESSTGKDAESSSMPPPKAMPSASTKAVTPEVKATSSGKPASDSAAAGSGDKEPSTDR